MRTDVTLETDDGGRHDVAIDAPADTRMSELANELRALCGARASAPLWRGADLVRDDSQLASMHTGSVLHVGTEVRRRPANGTTLRLSVVSGADAGASINLGVGTTTIGRADDCDLVLADPDVSRHHAAVTVGPNGIRVDDLGATNGTTIDGRIVPCGGAPLHSDQTLRVGDALLAIIGPTDPPALTHQDAGGIVVNRVPRSPTAPADVDQGLPVDPPAPPPRPVLSWTAALITAAVGGVAALALHNVEFLLFTAAMPAATIAVNLGSYLRWRRSSRRAQKERHQRTAEVEREVARAMREEAMLLRRAHPDAASIVRICTTPTSRIWERNRDDTDLLSVRVGTGDRRLATSSRPESDPIVRVIRDVPIVLDLASSSVAVTGPRAVCEGVARFAICQLAALCSPADVEIVAWLDADSAERWSWLRWLPHLLRPPAIAGADKQALAAHLAAAVAERRAATRARSEQFARRVVVIVDADCSAADARLLAPLRDAHDLGVTALVLASPAGSAPFACPASIAVRGETGSRLTVGTPNDSAVCVADQMSRDLAEQAARAIAPLVDPLADEAHGMSADCRLLELLQFGSVPSSAEISRYWRDEDGRPETIIGLGVNGPVDLDLVRDGPHALIAGTTGAGKSELLKTLVAGLSAMHPPDSISFVLIDYKGGAAFGACARLPHVLGVVTDLDGTLIARSLQSLDCEMRRREELFAALGAADIESYRADPRSERLPRLVLIVDEFAALAEDVPDLLQSLVGIAQRGRSLGLHLVLATQRPGGVVSPEIRANTALRIALRVADRGESIDVIGTDAAAAISGDTPGRAVLCRGSVLTKVHVAVISGRSHPRADRIRIERLGAWRTVPEDPTAQTSGPDDLSVLVDAIADAARTSGRRAVRVPWQPPLPEHIPRASLPLPDRMSIIHIGLIDIPRQQAQAPAGLDLDAGGAVLFAGCARSGRTTSARVIITSSTQQLPPERLHVYVIGDELDDLRELPHCGTVASPSDFDVVATLLRRLETSGRQRRSTTDVREVLVLDGWESFVAASEEADHGRSVERFLQLTRDAASAGRTVIITGNRTTLTPRLAGIVPTKFLLRLADPVDYTAFGIDLRDVPKQMPPGRAFRIPDGLSAQIALPGTGPPMTSSAATQAAPARPVRVRALPSVARLEELPPWDGDGLLLGLGGDAARSIGIDPFAGAARLLVSGPRGSGRSTVLELLLLGALRQRIPVIVAAASSPLLESQARRRGIAVVQPYDALNPIDAGTLVLADDSDQFADTPAGDGLAALISGSRRDIAVVVTASNDDVTLAFRGIAAAVRRIRRAIVLHPAHNHPAQSHLSLAVTPRTRNPAPPGRGTLLDPTSSAGARDGPIPVQIALPGRPELIPCAGTGDQSAGRKSP